MFSFDLSYFSVASRIVWRRVLLCAVFCMSIVPLSQASDWQYTMRPGDTLWSVCRQFSENPNCWRELPAYNEVVDPASLSVGAVVKMPVEWLKQAPVAARVIYVMGDVSYAAKGQAEAGVLVNQSLNIGTKLQVGNGSVTLQFGDGSLLTMGADSELVIDAVSAFKQNKSNTVEVSLPKGEATVSVPKRSPRTQFKVTTPASVAAVRGTKFRVRADGQSVTTTNEVLEGVVGVTSANDRVSHASTELAAGYGVRATKDQPLPAPKAIPPAPPFDLSCTDPGYVAWQSLPDVYQYKLVLMEDDTSVDRVLETQWITATNHTFEDLEEGCYQVSVNGIDVEGFNGLESRRRLCYEAVPQPPIIVETRLKRNTLSIDWNDVELAKSYRVEVSETSDFASLIDDEQVQQSNYSSQLPPGNDTVYVRVRSIAESGSEGFASESAVVEAKNSKGLLTAIVAAILAIAIL